MIELSISGTRRGNWKAITHLLSTGGLMRLCYLVMKICSTQFSHLVWNPKVNDIYTVLRCPHPSLPIPLWAFLNHYDNKLYYCYNGNLTDFCLKLFERFALPNQIMSSFCSGNAVIEHLIKVSNAFISLKNEQKHDTTFKTKIFWLNFVAWIVAMTKCFDIVLQFK